MESPRGICFGFGFGLTYLLLQKLLYFSNLAGQALQKEWPKTQRLKTKVVCCLTYFCGLTGCFSWWSDPGSFVCLRSVDWWAGGITWDALVLLRVIFDIASLGYFTARWSQCSWTFYMAAGFQEGESRSCQSLKSWAHKSWNIISVALR